MEPGTRFTASIVKAMMTIFWNAFGIPVLVTLTEKTLFEAEYFTDYVLIPIK
jgi:hypothetical protein